MHDMLTSNVKVFEATEVYYFYYKLEVVFCTTYLMLLVRFVITFKLKNQNIMLLLKDKMVLVN